MQQAFHENLQQNGSIIKEAEKPTETEVKTGSLTKGKILAGTSTTMAEVLHTRRDEI
jgi:hypothetical protein